MVRRKSVKRAKAKARGNKESAAVAPFPTEEEAPGAASDS